ncbi:MAG: hypothetical protein A3I00_07730 [Betaproteobacteria bacterium RIFCSPLOWO2_02_FULL_64_12]|nr:MAG: hypothetical protein A3I00_07730 [Betaproteobacteria bacterium RIFCSPLOWO2_02_FULL_64_12]
MSPMRRILVVLLKLAISLALIWFAFSKIDTGSAFGLLQSIHPGVVSGALALLVLQQFAAGGRLHRLMRLVRAPISLVRAVDAVFVGAFFMQTFISFIGGDAMRVWRMATAGVPIASAFKAVLLDRAVGFVALVALIVAGLPLLFRIMTEPAMRAGVVLAVILGMLGTLALLLMHRLPEALRRWRIFRIVSDISSLAMSISSRGADISFLLGVSLLIQVLAVIAMYVIAFGLGVEARFVDFLVLVPPVMLLAMLPISIAGWGVREGAMAVALNLVGIAAEQSVAISVCFGLCMMVLGLPGGLIWFIVRKGGAGVDILTDAREKR